MAKKEKKDYVCSSCGCKSPKWMGKCPDCGQWNTMVPCHPSSRRRTRHPSFVALDEVKEEGEERLLLPCEEMNRMLGGGMVRGSLVLLGGEPGVGKSTLVLQLASQMASKGEKVLYVSAEETLRQIKMRGQRIGAMSTGLYLLQEFGVESILDQVDLLSPGMLILDSIQTVVLEDLPSSPGTVVQVREAAAKVMEYAKARNITAILIGHVTKEGGLAGPKTLEHMVDTVLQMEGDKGQPYRTLRVLKNRYGPDMEVVLLEMKEEGLEEVKDPSALFIRERLFGSPGSVVLAGLQGSRPLLLEVQALVAPSAYGMPRRIMTGADPTRVSFILAVVEKHMGINMQGLDLFLNVPGGLRLTEPGADLALLLSLVSSFQERPLGDGTAVFGEVGLGGEVRGVRGALYRVQEASKHGFCQVVIPKSDGEKVSRRNTVKLIEVSHVREALEILMDL
jgi:DNA repair protein RadA/Sms